MEFGVRVLWAVFVLLVSMCYPCEARANNRKDLRSTPDTTKADANNESRNASSEDGRSHIRFYITFLRIVMGFQYLLVYYISSN